eukprot:GEMP01026622.1.p1 GENE.GEMP01026622.1~~GEMP01026622.1.p1  ORF type:complete len:214 (+),score=38.48 GEMP01026622.1:133-774(+)
MVLVPNMARIEILERQLSMLKNTFIHTGCKAPVLRRSSSFCMADLREDIELVVARDLISAQCASSSFFRSAQSIKKEEHEESGESSSRATTRSDIVETLASRSGCISKPTVVLDAKTMVFEFVNEMIKRAFINIASVDVKMPEKNGSRIRRRAAVVQFSVHHFPAVLQLRNKDVRTLLRAVAALMIPPGVHVEFVGYCLLYRPLNVMKMRQHA